MSLSRLPSELYSRREKSKRNSMSQIEISSLPKTSPQSPPLPSARRNKSASRPRPWSFGGDKFQLSRLKNPLAKKVPDGDGDMAGVRHSAHGLGSVSESVDSGLAILPIAHSKTTAATVSGDSAEHVDSSVNDDSGEWVDEEGLGATGAVAASALNSASFPGRRRWTDAHGAEDWDPLVYLKPSVSDSYAQGHSSRGYGDGDGALGTLLADLGPKSPGAAADDTSIGSSTGSSIGSGTGGGTSSGKGKEKVSPKTIDIRRHEGASDRSGLRQRRRPRDPGDAQLDKPLAQDSASSVGYKSSVGEAVAASIIDAER
ncbi:hypothetical protein LPJ75_006473, partial [Coemansia sp. RSA 2598]